MKTIIEMAQEAGWTEAGKPQTGYEGYHAEFVENITRFATLVKAAHVDELLEGVEMPEPVAYIAWRDGKPNYEGDDAICEDSVWPVDSDDDRESMGVVTTDQLRETVAAAVLRERESISQIHDAQEEMQSEIDELKAGNERLRADAARYQFIRVGDPDNAVMTWVNGLDDWTPWASPEDVDAAIDAAMKGQP